MATNFGDFQNEVYAEAVKGKTSRYPFDFESIERKASEALPDWRSTMAPTLSIAPITVDVRRIPESPRCSCYPQW